MKLFESHVGQIFSIEAAIQPQGDRGHHECEILEGGQERRVECGFLWKNCKKNPGHESFISVPDFKDEHLPYPLTSEEQEMLRAFVDLTVRLRVQWTSEERSEEDTLSQYRGTNKQRLGSGFIRHVSDVKSDEPCPCGECNGEVTSDFWTFTVQTARHVVFNSEEAEKTKVDLFFNDEDAVKEGRIKTVHAVKMVWCNSNWDICQILCVTHDKSLAERVKALEKCWAPLNANSIYTPENRGYLAEIIKEVRAPKEHAHAIVISHPHGKPKKITIGKWISSEERAQSGFSLEYHTATCPGSSGAPVLLVHSLVDAGFLPWSGPVHSGTFSKDVPRFDSQVNYSRSLNKL